MSSSLSLLPEDVWQTWFVVPKPVSEKRRASYIYIIVIEETFMLGELQYFYKPLCNKWKDNKPNLYTTEPQDKIVNYICNAESQ